MKLQYLFILISLISIGALYAAKQNPPPSAKHNSILYSQQEDAIYNEEKLNIALSPKQSEFTIQLKSNPTTGYSWYLREYDDKLIYPIKQNFEVAKSKLVGAPGIENWVFKVKETAFVVPQLSVIRFVYTRAWEKEDRPKQILFRLATVPNK